MSTVTLDQAIDAAMQLPPEQQEMLVEILQRRRIEARRREIAQYAEAARGLSRRGTQTAAGGSHYQGVA